MDDLTLDVGEAVTTTLEAVGEALVVDAHHVHERGVEIVDVDAA